MAASGLDGPSPGRGGASFSAVDPPADESPVDDSTDTGPDGPRSEALYQGRWWRVSLGASGSEYLLVAPPPPHLPDATPLWVRRDGLLVVDVPHAALEALRLRIWHATCHGHRVEVVSVTGDEARVRFEREPVDLADAWFEPQDAWYADVPLAMLQDVAFDLVSLPLH